MFVADHANRRIVSFQDGSGRVVLLLDKYAYLSCSPSGVVYVLQDAGTVVAKLLGETLQTFIATETLPADLQFCALDICVTKEEVIYLLDDKHNRILCINSAEPLKPVVVGQFPKQDSPDLWSMFVTEAGTIYVTDHSSQYSLTQAKVWAFRPGNTDPIEVLQCPEDLFPMAVLVHGSSMYVSMADDRDSPSTGGIYQYSLPPKLQLE